MCQQIVVERGGLSSPDASIAVLAFFVDGVEQAFAGDAPLHREVPVIVERGTFVRAPAHRTMVDDDIPVVIESVHGIVPFLLDVRSHARTDEADDDVVRLDSQRIVFQADAVARSGLSGNGQVSVIDIEWGLQFDDAAYGKYDGAWPFLADCPA